MGKAGDNKERENEMQKMQYKRPLDVKQKDLIMRDLTKFEKAINSVTTLAEIEIIKGKLLPVKLTPEESLFLQQKIEIQVNKIKGSNPKGKYTSKPFKYRK
jgi:hypothetical protein